MTDFVPYLPGNWTTRVFNQPGIYQFQLPQDFNENLFRFECWGGGQGGITPDATAYAGGPGGAAGWYSYTDERGQLPTPGYMPKKGDVVTIVIADYAAPVRAQDRAADGSWTAGNSTYIAVGSNPVCLAPGGAWLYIPVPSQGPVHQNFLGTDAVAGAGMFFGESKGINYLVNAGMNCGGGCAGGAAGAPVSLFSTFTPTGGAGGGSTNAVPGTGYWQDGGPTGAPYWPLPNEDTSSLGPHNAGEGLTNSTGNNFSGSTLTQGGYATHFSNQNPGQDGVLMPLPIRIDTVNGNTQIYMGTAGWGSGGGWIFNQIHNDFGANVFATAKSVVSAYGQAGTNGSSVFGQFVGTNGGDGGPFAGGGGGSNPMNIIGAGNGGRGGIGAAAISWLADIPGPVAVGALIPLPDPRYAGNRRLLFYPWGIK